MIRRVALCLVALAALAPTLGAVEARVVAGDDRARILPPAGAVIEPYANAGYRLTLGEAGAAVVEIDLAPLASATPFELPPAGDDAAAEWRKLRTANLDDGLGAAGVVGNRYVGRVFRPGIPSSPNSPI